MRGKMRKMLYYSVRGCAPSEAVSVYSAVEQKDSADSAVASPAVMVVAVLLPAVAAVVTVVVRDCSDPSSVLPQQHSI